MRIFFIMNNLQFFLVINLTIFLAEGLNDCQRHKRETNQHQCELSPQSYEGPLYVAENVLRSNITEYRPGVPLRPGVNKGGYSRNTPPEIENFQNTPPLSFEIFRRHPPSRPREARPLFSKKWPIFPEI